MTKPQQPQQKITMLQQSSLVFDCFSLLVTCTSFFSAQVNVATLTTLW